jgi:hypothetical protein
MTPNVLQYTKNDHGKVEAGVFPVAGGFRIMVVATRRNKSVKLNHLWFYLDQETVSGQMR